MQKGSININKERKISTSAINYFIVYPIYIPYLAIKYYFEIFRYNKSFKNIICPYHNILLHFSRFSINIEINPINIDLSYITSALLSSNEKEQDFLHNNFSKIS